MLFRSKAVALVDELAFVAEPSGGVQVVSLELPDRPREMAWQPWVKGALGVAARRDSQGRTVVVVAEGATPRAGTLAQLDAGVDEFGHVRLGGIGNLITAELAARTGWDTRATILGHVIRGGTPTAADRVLATRFGLGAIDAVHEGASGVMVALRGTDIVRVPLADAVDRLKTVPPERYAEAEVFFG